jgi:hypothetical protein
MLLHENATVTICHSRTRDLAVECGHADILVAAIGRPAAITAGFIKPGAVLINNVGMNRIANEAENVSSRARAPRCIRKEWLHPGRDVEPLAMRGISSADTVATSDLPLAYPPVNPTLSIRWSAAQHRRARARTGTPGLHVIYADRLGHAVLEPGGGAFQPAVAAFGPAIAQGGSTENARRAACWFRWSPKDLPKIAAHARSSISETWNSASAAI